MENKVYIDYNGQKVPIVFNAFSIFENRFDTDTKYVFNFAKDDYIIAYIDTVNESLDVIDTNVEALYDLFHLDEKPTYYAMPDYMTYFNLGEKIKKLKDGLYKITNLYAYFEYDFDIWDVYYNIDGEYNLLYQLRDKKT